MSALAVFLIAGAIVTFIGCYTYWIDRFGNGTEDLYVGAGWALLATIIWPIVWLIAIAAGTARLISGPAR